MPADFYGENIVCCGRKPYSCAWCGQRIEKGDTHRRYSVRWDGEFQCWRMHLECYEAMCADDDCVYDGFAIGENERPIAGALVVSRAAENTQATHIST
jgi:hypothetical protein